MNKRNFAALVAGVALLAAGMLAGCGNKDEAPADGAAAPGATTPSTTSASPGTAASASPGAAATPAAPPGPASK